MVNPFVNPVQAVTSKTPQDRPISPRPEAYEGFNHPYRGIENHGVESEYDIDPPIIHGDNDEDYENYPDEVPPIPVRIVAGETAREVRKWRTLSYPVGSSNVHVPVLGRDPKRISVRIINAGESGANRETVWIAPHDITMRDVSGVSVPANAIPILPGQTVELHTQEPIFVATATGGNVWDDYVYFLVEYASPDDSPQV